MERYEAYKDSGIEWIGEIPSHWDTLPFFAIFHEECRINGDLARTNALKFSAGTIVPKPDAWDLDEIGSTYSKYRVVDPDTIIINNLNLNFDLKSQRVGLVGVPGIITSAYIAIVPNDCINPRYAEYLFKSWDYKKVFHNMGKGLRLTLDWSELKHRKLILPSKQEQISIAEYLDKITRQIDLLIEKTERSIELLEEYRKSVISEVITKGLNPDVPMKDSDIEWIGVVPEHWEVKKFKYLAAVKANLVHPEDYPDLPQVSPDRILKDTGELLECQNVLESGVDSDNHLFREGQLLYSKVRPALNKVTIAPFDGLCSADMYPIETSEDPQWLKFSMLSQSFVTQVRVSTDRVKMPKVNKEELGSFYLPVPPKSEQERIAEYLNAATLNINAFINNEIALIDKLREYRKSLISEAVTGKFVVPGVE